MDGVIGELYGSAVETRIARDFMELPVWLKGGPEPSTALHFTAGSDARTLLKNAVQQRLLPQQTGSIRFTTYSLRLFHKSVHATGFVSTLAVLLVRV